MTLTTKNRSQLKSYFVKNAIPTQGNFADLIEAPLNQADDGIFKLAGEPLSVVAAPGDQRRVLRFYSTYPSAAAEWIVSLNPAQDPNVPATTRPGFGITDGVGNTRLFVDAKTGHLGFGTNNPAERLDVAGNIKANRFVGENGLTLGDYQVPRPTSNVYLWSPPGDRDAWIYLDRVDANSNWGIYHRQIDSAIKGLPANSIGFVGGGNSALKAYIGLQDGAAMFAGPLTVEGQTTLRGVLSAQAGLTVQGAVSHIEHDGALYRHNDGQVYLTVDDNLYLRDVGSDTVAAHFDTNTGSLRLRGGLTVGSNSTFSGNDGMLSLEGRDHAYIQFFPQTIAKGRKSWIGYGGANTNTLSVFSEGGHLLLAGTEVFVNGKLNIESDSILRGIAYAVGGLVFDGAVTHIDRNGALYRHVDGQVYFTVDDNLYLRNVGANTVAAHFDTNTGSLRLRGGLTVGSNSTFTGNDAVLSLEGRDHAYIQLFPQTIAKGRKAWIGYGGANTTTLSIASEAGPISIGGTEIFLAPKVTVNGDLIVNQTINAAGRLHIAGGELLYLLNKNGVVIGRDWGGSGDLSVQGTITYGVNLVKSSLRYKQNVRPLTDCLGAVQRLSPVRYDLREELTAGADAFGFIAEDVRAVEPALVHDERPGQFFTDTLRPDSLVALAIGAIQELSRKVARLERRAADPTDRPHTPADGFEILSQETLRGRDGADETYVAVRFTAHDPDLGPCDVVRYLRLPADEGRTEFLARELSSWRTRLTSA